MENYQKIIAEEKARLALIVKDMQAILAEEQQDKQAKNQELAELKRQKLEAIGWREKQEIDERIRAFQRHWNMRRYNDPIALNQPYFGVLELDDDDLGTLSNCLGRRSFFGRSGKVLVIDWREAPVSRLYYEYEAGEFYDEEIQGRDRSGTIRAKRKVETTGGELRSILENNVQLICYPEEGWRRADETAGAVSRKEEKADHRLPEITALISREQFQAITHLESSTVVLQGGAGSGKTTVGLHRIAYLAYQDPERFRPDRILVVVFNRSLRHYISGVLPQLGMQSGVLIETYHSLAGRLLRSAGMRISYSTRQPNPNVTRFKKSPEIMNLIDDYLEILLSRSRDWFLGELEGFGDPSIHEIKENLQSAASFADFFQMLNNHSLFTKGIQPTPRSKTRQSLIKRLHRHQLDLHAALSNRKLLEKAMTVAEREANPRLPDQVESWQRKLRNEGKLDFADIGILLWLMQRKGLASVRPNYAHVMVDEAQDLSEVELATLLYAADRRKSITICGDMAQKIKGEVSFESAEGFAGFIRDQQIKTGAMKVQAESLMVGYRAARPIMELAWHVLEEKPAMRTSREGEPVQIIRTKNHEETIASAAKLLQSYRKRRPNALVAVVCRFKAEADRVGEDLRNAGMANLRRHQRDDFTFEPGVVVTNAHQVKGLEFSAVLIINPAADSYPDDRENRMLLHVVITRAADHLWLIGHQPMAYGLEDHSQTRI